MSDLLIDVIFARVNNIAETWTADEESLEQYREWKEAEEIREEEIILQLKMKE